MKVVWLLVSACLGVMAVSLLFSQSLGPIKGLESIPSERRGDLLQKLNQLIALYRTENWPGVYGRLTHLPPIEESLTQFAKRVAGAYPRNVGRKLMAFEPDNIVEQPASQWVVWGCATLNGKARRSTRERWLIIASWERGEWFFSELRPATQLDAKKPIPCHLQKSN